MSFILDVVIDSLSWRTDFLEVFFGYFLAQFIILGMKRCKRIGSAGFKIVL